MSDVDTNTVAYTGPSSPREAYDLGYVRGLEASQSECNAWLRASLDSRNRRIDQLTRWNGVRTMVRTVLLMAAIVALVLWSTVFQAGGAQQRSADAPSVVCPCGPDCACPPECCCKEATAQ